MLYQYDKCHIYNKYKKYFLNSNMSLLLNVNRFCQPSTDCTIRTIKGLIGIISNDIKDRGRQAGRQEVEERHVG